MSCVNTIVSEADNPVCVEKCSSDVGMEPRLPNSQCALQGSLQLGQDNGRGRAHPPPFTILRLTYGTLQFVENRLYEMRANMQAAKLGYSSSPVATTFPTSVHAFPPHQVASHPNTHPNLEALGYRSEKSHLGNVQMGDETKMPLIQRLLTAKMGCVDQAGVERDIVSEAMGHLSVCVSSPCMTRLLTRIDIVLIQHCRCGHVVDDARVHVLGAVPPARRPGAAASRDRRRDAGSARRA